MIICFTDQKFPNKCIKTRYWSSCQVYRCWSCHSRSCRFRYEL